MNQLPSMLNSHPTHADLEHPGWLACLAASQDCAQVCRSCADACVVEATGEMLIRCVRLNMDCAAVCDATAQVLARTSEPDWKVVTALLNACATACAACAGECEQHAQTMEHCRLCAEACLECEAACLSLGTWAKSCCS